MDDATISIRIARRYIIEKETPEYILAQESLRLHSETDDYGIFYADDNASAAFYDELCAANKAEIVKFHAKRLKRKFNL